MGRLTFVVVVAFAALASAGCSKRYSIPSASMTPTIVQGDHVRAEGLDEMPERGDVVVFALAGDWVLERARSSYEEDDFEYIHRVVAVGGDKVRLEGNRVVLNGAPIETEPLGPTEWQNRDEQTGELTGVAISGVLQRERIGARSWTTQHLDAPAGGRGFLMMPHPDWPLAYAPDYPPTWGGRDENPHFPDVLVPEGHVFVLGDNRDAAKDSRYLGCVPVTALRAVATEVLWNEYDPAREDVPLR